MSVKHFTISNRDSTEEDFSSTAQIRVHSDNVSIESKTFHVKWTMKKRFKISISGIFEYLYLYMSSTKCGSILHLITSLTP